MPNGLQTIEQMVMVLDEQIRTPKEKQLSFLLRGLERDHLDDIRSFVQSFRYFAEYGDREESTMSSTSTAFPPLDGETANTAELKKLLPENRPFVIVESPFGPPFGHWATLEEHATYLKRCLKDSFDRGELPFASHGFFPQFLNDENPVERNFGIAAGYRFWNMSGLECIAFYVDYGFSSGMIAAHERAVKLMQETTGHIYVDIRSIGRNESDIPF